MKTLHRLTKDCLTILIHPPINTSIQSLGSAASPYNKHLTLACRQTAKESKLVLLKLFQIAFVPRCSVANLPSIALHLATLLPPLSGHWSIPPWRPGQLIPALHFKKCILNSEDAHLEDLSPKMTKNYIFLKQFICSTLYLARGLIWRACLVGAGDRKLLKRSVSRALFFKFLYPPVLEPHVLQFQAWTIAFTLFWDTTPPQKLCTGSAGMEKRFWKAQRTTQQDLRLFLKTTGLKSKIRSPQHTLCGLIAAWLSPIPAARHRLSTQSPRPVVPSGEVCFDFKWASVGFFVNVFLTTFSVWSNLQGDKQLTETFSAASGEF